MKIIRTNVEGRLLEEVQSAKGQLSGHSAIHFNLHMLQDEYSGSLQQKIAVNILNDIFRNDKGHIYECSDGDIVVFCYDIAQKLLQKADHQLRYLYEDDPLAYNLDGSQNDDFCEIYDLSTQWRAFYRICSEREEFANQVLIKPKLIFTEDDEKKFSPHHLAEIMYNIGDIDFDLILRKQPICAIKGDTKKPRVVFHEIYVNIGHLTTLLNEKRELTSNRWLFGFLCEELDRRVLDLISDRPKAYINRPVSINLNIDTIFTDEFEEFCNILHKVMKAPIVIELQISDVFYDMEAFIAAKAIIDKKGYRTCIDGLTTKSFVQIDRAGLGFDLAKIRWNADIAEDLVSENNKRYVEAVKKYDPNRIILCRCDNEYAIDYGHALGISLFQGRYTDKLINPAGNIKN